MSQFVPIREIPTKSGFGEGDVLVIFGEVFSRGYVNGLIEEAQKNGLKVIYSTVGRRDAEQSLRKLTQSELSEKATPLINVPLEAGFDLEPSDDGTRPIDQLSGVKLTEWQKVKLDWDKIAESKRRGEENFKARVKAYLVELQQHLPPTGNILFAHTMAGGFPRAKIVMPIANRVFKGYGERFQSSKEFWDSEIGRLCNMSFDEVTGETLKYLIDLTSDLRQERERQGYQVSYVAYGYHGTEVLVGGEYQWQSYSPYLQGWAKLHLEEVAKNYYRSGVAVSVYNCPEILTNSSSIFLGVEVSLYPLLGALQKEGGSTKAVAALLADCQSKLKDEYTTEDILQFTEKYLQSDVIREWTRFEFWPQHNGPEQMEKMRTSSAHLIEMHKDTKDLITQTLSEVVFKACGHVLFTEGYKPKQPVGWIGHDLIAKLTSTSS